MTSKMPLKPIVILCICNLTLLKRMKLRITKGLKLDFCEICISNRIEITMSILHRVMCWVIRIKFRHYFD